MAATDRNSLFYPCEEHPAAFMALISRLAEGQVRALCWKNYNFELGQLTVPAALWDKPLDLIICFEPCKQQWLKSHYRRMTLRLGRAPRQGERMFPEPDQN